MHVRTSYVCPMVLDVRSTSRCAYITITILNDLAYVTGSVPQVDSFLNPRLLTIGVHNYYAQPIYYTHVSKYYEPLTDWSITLVGKIHT